jgi:uncharacterized protein (TIGR03435 family)
MRKFLPALALVCSAWAQDPAFEVASVKPTEPITPAMIASGRAQIGVSIDARAVRISKFSLFDLIHLAFQLKSHEMSIPGWTITERYDVQATLPEGASRAQVPAMLRTLLKERFHMVSHKETREVPIFALVEAKGGHKLKPSQVEEVPAAPSGQIRGGMSVTAGGGAVSAGPSGNTKITPGAGGNQHVEGVKMTMENFAGFIGRYCERPVLDFTGIPGRFDLEIDVSGEEVRNAARSKGVNVGPAPVSDVPADPSGVSLISSLARLGLKLEARKSPVEVVVIDRIDKVPTEN